MPSIYFMGKNKAKSMENDDFIPEKSNNTHMSLIDRLKMLLSSEKHEKVAESQDEKDATTSPSHNATNEKIELVLNRLEGLSMMLKVHDNRLIKHDQDTATQLVELLSRKGLIPTDKRQEAIEVVEDGLRANKERSLIIKDLMEQQNLSRATSYRIYNEYVANAAKTEKQEESHTETIST